MAVQLTWYVSDSNSGRGMMSDTETSMTSGGTACTHIHTYIHTYIHTCTHTHKTNQHYRYLNPR